MKTVRLTMAQALVRYLANQKTEIDGREEPRVHRRVRAAPGGQRDVPDQLVVRLALREPGELDHRRRVRRLRHVHPDGMATWFEVT